MLEKLNTNIIESYLDCKYKAYLQFIGMVGEISEFERLAKDARNHVHLTAVTKLKARHGHRKILLNPNLVSAELKKGLPLLINAVIENDKESICFDALEKIPGRSGIGEFHYIPVLFHEAEHSSQKLRSILEIYSLILGSLQGKKPDYGIIIHGQSCKFTKTKMKLLDGVARRKLQELRELQSGKQPRLYLNQHCHICEFCKHCYSEAKDKDDLSLLRKLSEKELIKYNKKGIFTVTQLSYTFRPRKRRNKSHQKPPPRQHALQALAIREQKVYIYGSPGLPVFSTRIFLDLEGDPDRRFVYLIGMIVQTGDKEERYSFWANTQAEEPLIYQQFLKVIEQYEDYQIYSYGRYEANFLKRMLKHADQRELGEKILERLLNVLTIIYSFVYFPVYTNGLKDIGSFLGFNWIDEKASGIQSIVWRRNWETSDSSVPKKKLINYNIEDCAALKKVTDFLYMICNINPSEDKKRGSGYEKTEISRVKDIDSPWSRREWCKANFIIPDFDLINKCAYYDYQREKVYIRSSKTIKQNQALKRKGKNKKKNLRATQRVEINSQECPFCRGEELIRRRDDRLSRVAYDLRLSRSGLKRKVIRVKSSWHWCKKCGKRFLPREYLRMDEYFHSLKSWALYENVVHRTSFGGIAEKIREYFGIPVRAPDVSLFKKLLSRYYEDTYQLLLKKIMTGTVIHADETQIRTRHANRGYVWVFTNLEEVIYIYRKTREGEFLKNLLKNFRGVLVSDFYSPYDSLDCIQQKCLIHLIRDFNHDLQSNPWDDDLKSLASEFGRLLRKIVATIDQFGLKKRYLIKHRRDVYRFFSDLSAKFYRSEVAESYQKRLIKYQDKLFTFLSHDGVSWNNNNAEHAIKHFAYYRERYDGQISEVGLNEYLPLLSIYVSCKYKGLSFLKFLLSREKDIDLFRMNGSRVKESPLIELVPEDFNFPRRKRKSDWDQGARNLYDNIQKISDKKSQHSDSLLHGASDVKKIDSSEIDTIVVPAKEKNFLKTFIGKNCWFPIRIRTAMINKIKNIAAYRVAPRSAITHIAKVEEIMPWKGTTNYIFYFSEPVEQITPIPLVPGGIAKAPQDFRYTSLQKLRTARNLDEVFYIT